LVAQPGAGPADVISVANYLFPNWSIDFLTLTDISTLATMLYIAYPTALVLISIALWVVMIGIIKLTGVVLASSIPMLKWWLESF
jgi:hypothetical protein